MPPRPGRAGSLESWEHVATTAVEQTRTRHAVVTIAGVLLILAGAFAGVGGLLILLAGDDARIEGVAAGVSTYVALALAGLEVLSGLLVLRRSPTGRMLGIVVAGLGIAGGLATVGSPPGIVTIAIFGFVVFALVRSADAFGRTRER